MRKSDLATSIRRGAYAYPLIVFVELTGPGCGSKDATRPAPSLADGKAIRAIFADAPKGFGPDPKAPLGKSIIDVPAPINPRRR
jgi:hypothetical protein